MSDKKVNGTDVIKWIKTQSLPMSILAVLGTLFWVAYAEPKVKAVVEDSIKITKEKVEKMEEKMEHIKFESHQQLYLLKKLVGKTAVNEMEEETEMFKPDGYVNK